MQRSGITPDAEHQRESHKPKARHHKQEQGGQPPTGDHKAHINKCTKAQRTQDRKNTKDPQKKHQPGTVSKIPHWRAQTGPTAPTLPPTQMWIKTHRYPACKKDPQPTNAPSPRTHKSRHNKETKQKTRTQQK